MTIKQLSAMPVGQRVGGFPLTVKTAKKKWQENYKWVHQVLVMDETGEMLADVIIDRNNPLQRTQRFWVIVSKIQEGEKGKKLLVSQFRRDTIIGEPPNTMGLSDTDKEIRGKVFCRLTGSKIETGATTREVKGYITDPIFKEIVEIIMSGGK